MKLCDFLVSVAGITGLLSPAVTAFETVFTKQHCYTIFATTKTPKHLIPTVTTSVTSNYILTESLTTTPTYTSIPTGTLTTIATFVTKTVTVTNGKGTFTSTVTQTETDTATIDTVKTIIPTTTITQTVTPTFTHSPPGAFTPLASDPAVISAGGGSSKLRRAKARAARADYALDPRSPASDTIIVSNGATHYTFARYEHNVVCSHIVESFRTTTSSFTAVSAHIVTAPSQPPLYTTVTSTVTRTTTVPTQPAPTVTTTTRKIIFKTITMTTSTTIESQTATISTFGPFVTVYPACGTDNLISYVGGNPIDEVVFPTLPFTDGMAQNFVDCCVSCQDAAECGDFAFYDGQCILATVPGTCNPYAKDMTFLTKQGGEPGFVVGNGNCGSAKYGGVE